jgi:hypothetical protein
MNRSGGTLIAAIVICLCGTPLVAQPTVRVVSNSWISSSSPKSAQAESYLAVNPRNQKNMVASTAIVEDGLIGVAVYSTRDGGRTWRRAKTAKGDSVFMGWDNHALFDIAGHAFVITPGRPQETMDVYRSDDGGLTFQQPTQIHAGGGVDRFYAGTDLTGRFAGRIYVSGIVGAYTLSGAHPVPLFLATLDNGGKRVRRLRIFAAPDDKGISPFSPSDLLVTPDGALIIPFPVRRNDKQRWGTDDAPAFLGLYTSYSLDGGNTVSTPKVDSQTTKSAELRTLGLIMHSAIDTSRGPYSGRIYVISTDRLAGREVVRVRRSSDYGTTWSDPVAIDAETVPVPKTASKNPDDLYPNAPQAPSNVAVTVNKDGVVAALWLDRRADTTGMCYTPYVAVSVDGGESFTAGTPISDDPTCPHNLGSATVGTFSEPMSTRLGPKPVQITSTFSVGSRFLLGGESEGFAADAGGMFHVAWSKEVSGVMQLWHTAFKVENIPTALSSNRATSARRGPWRIDEAGEDLADLVDIIPVRTITDRAKRTLTTELKLVNTTRSTLRGPFTVVLSAVNRFGASQARVTNTENGKQGEGGAWTVRGNLVPGGSLPLVVKYSFDPETPENEYNFANVVTHFRIFAPAR